MFQQIKESEMLQLRKCLNIIPFIVRVFQHHNLDERSFLIFMKCLL